MATKRTCDRCGSEINPIYSVTYTGLWTPQDTGRKPIELCCSCAFHLRKWLKGGADNG